MFCWKKCDSHFCSKNIENTLATTVNKFVTNELVKQTMLWLTDLQLAGTVLRILEAIDSDNDTITIRFPVYETESKSLITINQTSSSPGLASAELRLKTGLDRDYVSVIAFTVFTHSIRSSSLLTIFALNFEQPSLIPAMYQTAGWVVNIELLSLTRLFSHRNLRTLLWLRADRGASWPHSSFYIDGTISPVVPLVY